MLELTNVSKSFGGIHAVRNVSMQLETGQVHGLIGPNGAGKSTLVNLISGLLTHSAGTISLDDRPLDALTAAQRAERGIARTFQNLRIFQTLTVEQNIEVASYTAERVGRSAAAIVQEAIHEFDLEDKLNVRANSLAYGQLRRLEIVRALALMPKVLMLDEPAAGMNEQETAALEHALGWLRGKMDCALLVIDHDLKFIMSLCTKITVLNMGTVIAEGSPRDVSENGLVIDAYLGKDDAHAA